MAKENKSERKAPNLRFPGFEGDWEKRKLGDIGEVKMCKRIFHNETSLIGDIPFYKIGSFGKKADAFISKELYLDYKTRFSFPNKGDILISAAGTIGRTVIYDGEDAYFQDSNIVWIDNDNSNVTNGFLYYILQIVKHNTEGGTIQRLYNNVLKSAKFNNPSISEQAKITSFLSLIDKRIETQNKIIENLKVQMLGLQKKIFKRKIMMKDEQGNEFPEWESKKVKELFTFITTNSFSREQLNYENGTVKNIHYGDVHTKFHTLFNVEKEKVPYINTSVKIDKINKNNYCQIGDMIFADASEDLTDVGKSIEIVNLNNQKLLAGLHTILARPINGIFSVGFCGYLFKSDSVKSQIQKEAQGSKVLSISTIRLSKVFLSIPCIDEQIKIVDLLSSIDAKIILEKMLLRKLETQKYYLLRNLFT